MNSEKIALAEKKMDMTLDDIIKMSKDNTLKPRKQRVSNRNQKVFNNTAQNKPLKVERFMNSRSYLRQGALARRRSNFQGNHFPFSIEAAKRAYVAPAPIHNRPANPSGALHFNKPRTGSHFVQKPAGNGGFNVKEPQQQQAAAVVAPKQKPQTLDSLFASMKEQRMMKNNGPRRNGGGQNRNPWFRNHNFRN